MESLQTGWLEIRSHKMRSFLSFFAISIGVASILYTLAQIKGVNQRVAENFKLMGPGRLEIEKKRDYVSRGLSAGLNSDDADAIRQSMPELYMVYPLARAWGMHFRFREFYKEDFVVTGVTEEWSKRDWVYQLRGRFLNSEDVRRGNRVCLLIQPGGWIEKPWWAKFFREMPIEGLLKRRDLLGQTVMIGDHLFAVIGILSEPPRDKDPRWGHNSYGGSGTVLVPVTTYQRLLARRGDGSPRSVSEIQVDTGEEATVPLYKRRIEGLLKARHREEDYEVKDNRDEIQGILNSVRQYVIAILAVGIVAILAGGIGIMNVTLATIYSRIKEIGVRRAVGATRGDILRQFVVEAMILGFLGGVAGLGLGTAGVLYLSRNADRDFSSLTPFHFLLTLAIAVGTGFLFSLYPASKAAQLDPIEALHYE
ncbi:MAG: ABC transporter permease [Elusimicrobia bacterium]|nr:ABC transporter permease [Elusimicrobiota bacterium]